MSTVVSIEDCEARRRDVRVPMWRARFEAGVGIVDPHPLEDRRACFLDEGRAHDAIEVAVRDRRLVGPIAATRESGTQPMVHGDPLRRGIGRRLLERGKALSAGSLRLFTGARNTGARAFDGRRGFGAVAHGFEPVWQPADMRDVGSAESAPC